MSTTDKAALDAERAGQSRAEEHSRLQAEGWPPALIKALDDVWAYAALVRNVGWVAFSLAEDAGGGWVTLRGSDTLPLRVAGAPEGLWFGRGLEVRVSDILAAADGES